MENSIYLGLSRQMTLKTNLDIIANNVANMNTTGFRAQNLLFEEFISDPRGADDPLSFVIDQGEYKNTDQGSIKATGNPLDVALEGPGFIGIQGANGETTYTRDGIFQTGADGTLRTSTGFTVAGQGGGIITVPDDSIEVRIDHNGVVSNQDGELGRIMVVEFENVQALEPVGNNQYRSDEQGQTAANTIMKQGFVEGSNVKPVVEMTRMIDTLRSFQSVQNILQSENERLRSAIEQLTKTG